MKPYTALKRWLSPLSEEKKISVVPILHVRDSDFHPAIVLNGFSESYKCVQHVRGYLQL